MGRLTEQRADQLITADEAGTTVTWSRPHRFLNQRNGEGTTQCPGRPWLIHEPP